MGRGPCDSHERIRPEVSRKRHPSETLEAMRAWQFVASGETAWVRRPKSQPPPASANGTATLEVLACEIGGYPITGQGWSRLEPAQWRPLTRCPNSAKPGGEAGGIE